MTALDIKSSLGIGMMVGAGIAVIIKEILPRSKRIFGPMFKRNNLGDSIIGVRWTPIVMSVLAFCFTIFLDMTFIASIITIIGVWIVTAMSCQCVGQSGINPIEILGIIVLVIVKTCSSIGEIESFFVAAIVVVACGLVGDIMNDFKSGHILNTDPKSQWIGETIGALEGSVVLISVLFIILNAYGSNVFGSGIFPAAQASAIAAMIGGISNIQAFVIGFLISVVLYLLGFPVMTLGLGVYLPFYLSLTVFIGGALRFILDKICPKLERF